MMSLMLGDSSSSLTSDPLMMMMMGQGQGQGAGGQMNPLLMMSLLGDDKETFVPPAKADLEAKCAALTNPQDVSTCDDNVNKLFNAITGDPIAPVDADAEAYFEAMIGTTKKDSG